MKYIKLFIFSFVVTACCSHRSMTTESRVLSLDSAVTLFSSRDSIVASHFDSIISSLEVTIDYLVINDSTKEKKVTIHARKEQVTKENTEHKVDSSRFTHQENSFKSEEDEQTIMKRNREWQVPVLIMCFIVFIICAFIVRKWN